MLYLLFAAGMNSFGALSITTDGLEEVFGVNYVGHFLLTQLLLPALQASAAHHREQLMQHDRQHGGQKASTRKATFCGPRIVNLSSVMHRHSNSEDLLYFTKLSAEVVAASAAVKLLGGSTSKSTTVFPCDGKQGVRGSAYSASKLAMVVMTAQLECRLRNEAFSQAQAIVTGDDETEIASLSDADLIRVRAVSVNPGAVNSEIWRSLSFCALWGRRALGALCFLHPEDGAATTIFGATARPEDGWRTGAYITPYWIPFGACPAAYREQSVCINAFRNNDRAWLSQPDLSPQLTRSRSNLCFMCCSWPLRVLDGIRTYRPFRRTEDCRTSRVRNHNHGFRHG